MRREVPTGAAIAVIVVVLVLVAVAYWYFSKPKSAPLPEGAHGPMPSHGAPTRTEKITPLTTTVGVMTTPILSASSSSTLTLPPL